MKVQYFTGNYVVLPKKSLYRLRVKRKMVLNIKMPLSRYSIDPDTEQKYKNTAALLYFTYCLTLKKDISPVKCVRKNRKRSLLQNNTVKWMGEVRQLDVQLHLFIFLSINTVLNSIAYHSFKINQKECHEKEFKYCNTFSKWNIRRSNAGKN